MKCRVCGKDFNPFAAYQKFGGVCSLSCYQDIYNENLDDDVNDKETNEVYDDE